MGRLFLGAMAVVAFAATCHAQAPVPGGPAVLATGSAAAPIWTPGHWYWNAGEQNYIWIAGAYVAAPGIIVPTAPAR